MKKAAWVLTGLLSAGVLGLPAYVQAKGTGHVHNVVAAEKDVNFDDIPKVVQDSVVKASGGAKVHHVVQYDVHGRNHFHVIVGNHEIRQTLILDEAGNLLITKDTVDFDSLPGPVKETFGKEAGSGRMLDSVEKATKGDKSYFIGTVVEKDGNDKVIRVESDGKLIGEDYEEDAPLAGERAIPQTARVVREDMKSEPVKFDDLPGQVKTTIGAAAKSDSIDNVLKLYPPKDPIAFVATVGKDPAKQRKIFVDEKGDLLEGAEIAPYIEAAPAEHPHKG